MKSKVKEQFKICKTCLKPFNNRAKWAKRNLWDKVIYCSDACRIKSRNVKNPKNIKL